MVKLQAGYREIAKILGASEGTLRSFVDQLRKARKLSTGPRGPGAVDMTAIDASWILHAFLHGKATDCVEAAERTTAFRHYSMTSNTTFHRDFIQTLGLEMDHTAADMTAALLCSNDDLIAIMEVILGEYKAAWVEKIASEWRRPCGFISPFVNVSYTLPVDEVVIAFGYDLFSYLGGDRLHTINIELTYRAGSSVFIPFTDFRRVSSFGLKTIQEISTLLRAK
jgi:hypothetical protein